MTFPSLEIQLTREYLMRMREAYLLIVDVYELMLEISPRTSELRRAEKQNRMILQLEKEQESEKV